jgi:hypothetical protein
MDELEAMLRASREGEHFSLARFGEAGLQACNPLFAFQLMNNFTLCHGAILEGLGGPNAAFFSRGSGTVVALTEALHALAEGDAERALAGGADSALHPVTRAELVRDAHLPPGREVAEGAAVLALAREAAAPQAWVVGCALGPWRESVSRELEGCASLAQGTDLVLSAAWSPGVQARLDLEVEAWAPGIRVSAVEGGEALAATPALVWARAVDLLQQGEAGRILVLTAGIDGDLGAVALARRRP